MLPAEKRFDVGKGLGPSDRDLVLGRLGRLDDLLARILRIEEAQHKILALLMESRKDEKVGAVEYDRFIRRSEVTSMCGFSISTLYVRISARLFPAPIRLGARMVAWRYSEVVAVNEARLRGATDDELRVVVSGLEATRKVE